MLMYGKLVCWRDWEYFNAGSLLTEREYKYAVLYVCLAIEYDALDLVFFATSRVHDVQWFVVLVMTKFGCACDGLLRCYDHGPFASTHGIVSRLPFTLAG